MIGGVNRFLCKYFDAKTVFWFIVFYFMMLCDYKIFYSVHFLSNYINLIVKLLAKSLVYMLVVNMYAI